MRDLIHELIPHAPQMGLYVAPKIPEKKIKKALGDYAKGMEADEVLALFDATLIGNAGDGAVFAVDRFAFQNNDREPAHEIRYDDLVRVEKKRGFFKGAKVLLEVNRGRATFDLKLDCSAHPEALEFLYRFVHEAMLRPVVPRDSEGVTPGETDLEAVERALDTLLVRGLLTDSDRRRMLAALGEGRAETGQA